MRSLVRLLSVQHTPEAQFHTLFFRVNSSLESCIYFTLRILISSVTWLAHDTWLVANGQLTTLTESMQPNAPPARWHLWVSAALPASQHRADCKCYQRCQVESIFVSDIGSHDAQQTVLWRKTTVGSCVEQRSDKTRSASELSTGRSFCDYRPPSLFLHQAARLCLFPYGTSPPGVWYAGV